MTLKDIDKVEKELQKIVNGSIKTTIKPVKFRDTRTGEIKTQVNIFDLKYMENVEKPKPKPKKPSPDAPFSAYLQYQIDLDKWKRTRF